MPGNNPRPLLRPPMLRPGDLIGVVSPSAPVAHEVPRRLQRGLAELERLGFRTRVSEHATGKHGHSAGTIDERLTDLHTMFAAPEVKAIICTIGGTSSHQLLATLDFDLIAANPKIFLGYSDITALHLAIHQRTGLVTFLGPAVLPQFAEPGGIMPYVWERLAAVICQTEPAGAIPPATAVVDERQRWDVNDDEPRRLRAIDAPTPLRTGQAQGRIVAGHLGTMLLLAGTSFWPDLQGAILCVEPSEDDVPEMVERQFTQLRHLGAFEQIAGLAVGRVPPELTFPPDLPFADIVASATRGYDSPIALVLAFGHLDPAFTLPNGVLAGLDVTDTVTLSLLEPAVSHS